MQYSRVSTTPDTDNYYRQALIRYQGADTTIPDDPRPLSYEGLCYGQLTGIEQYPEQAPSLSADGREYSLAVPHSALASVHFT